MPSINEPIYRVNAASTCKAWKQRLGRYRLSGSYCTECGIDYFPKRKICPKCKSASLSDKEFNPLGEVICTAINYTPIIGFAETVPNIRALIRLENGPVVAADVIEARPEEVTEGTRVEMVIRKLKRESNGIYMYGYKFRPRHSS